LRKRFSTGEPTAQEDELADEFISIYGPLPFSNLNRPRGETP